MNALCPVVELLASSVMGRFHFKKGSQNMKTLFVVMPFGTSDMFEVASKVAFEVEKLLGQHLQLLPLCTSSYGVGLYFEANDTSDAKKPLVFLHNSLGYMLSADYVAFAPDYRGHRECQLLRAIAAAYELNVIESAPELKACPFCNAPDVSIHKVEDGYNATCDNCGASGPLCTNEKAATTAWNNVR